MRWQWNLQCCAERADSLSACPSFFTPRRVEEGLDGGSHALRFMIREGRMNGQAQRVLTQMLRVGAASGAEFCERVVTMQRDRIMHHRGNVLRRQMLPQRVAPSSGDDKQMIVAGARLLL